MHTYEKLTFADATITLDHCGFIECEFRSCTLVYGGGPLQMVRNRLTGCNFVFTDAAERTIELLTKLGMLQPAAPCATVRSEFHGEQPFDRAVATPHDTAASAA